MTLDSLATSAVGPDDWRLAAREASHVDGRPKAYEFYRPSDARSARMAALAGTMANGPK